MLGFEVSETSVSRWMKRAPKDPQPAKRWLAFLRNHREAIAAMDFFTVPTLTFGVLYCFFIISHDRRRILHFNVTRHPTSTWIVQQLREAFPYDSAPRFLLFDHDAKYGFQVPATIRSMNITAVRTSVGCPWQNGVAERWVGSCRRELLDHVHRSERATSATSPLRLHLLLSLRSNPSRIGQMHARTPQSVFASRSGCRQAAAWRLTPPLRPGCLRSRSGLECSTSMAGVRLTQRMRQRQLDPNAGASSTSADSGISCAHAPFRVRF